MPAQVVPFLVLAVGVDNIFIMVQSYQRSEPLKGESVPEHVGRVVGKVGPSILVSTTAEALCFFLGLVEAVDNEQLKLIYYYNTYNFLNVRKNYRFLKMKLNVNILFSFSVCIR